MKSAPRLNWSASFIVFASMLIAAGLSLPGCSPATDKTAPTKTVKEESNKSQPSLEEPAKDKTATETANQKEPVKAQAPRESGPRAASKIELPPGAPKMSMFAPAEDLENQLDDYLKDLIDAVAGEQDYKDLPEGMITREANTVIVLALALGMHDEENKYMASAAAVMKAAEALAVTKDYASAKKAVESLLSAAGAKGSPGGLKWEKAAALDQLMKQVPLVHTKLKTKTEASRFKSKAKDTEGYSATLAAIAQASIADTSQAKNDEDIKKWQTLCIDMRDTAGAVNAAIRRQDQPAAEAAMNKLQQNCDDCHKVFHPAALEKKGE
jgi:hypothetical protein